MDKRTLLAFLIIALILMLIPSFYRMVGLTEPEEEDKTASPVQQRTAPDAISSIEPTSRDPRSPYLSADPTDTTLERQLETERFFPVKTNLYSATVSSLGGGNIVSYFLKDYYTENGYPVNLIRSDISYENLLIRFDDMSGDPVVLSHPFALVEPYEENDTLTVGPQGLTFTFQTRLVDGVISKKLTFYPDRYIIDLAIDLSSVSRRLISQELFTLNWGGGLPTTEKNVKDDAGYFAAHLYQGGELTKIERRKLEKSVPVLRDGHGRTEWAATRSKYFTAALIPIDESLYGRIFADPYDPPNTNSAEPPLLSIGIEFSSSKPVQCSLFLGPLKYSLIKRLSVGLEKTMNLGLAPIRPISKGVLYLLTSMHKFVPNYGVLLIIFSILVKIVVYPLTKKSYQSTKKMQAIQPLIIEMREKHKGDAQKLNKATMNLYKEHGVNPLGGCLPMLLQMPLLFALFIVFRTTIELRQAPFVLWINDLSSPDALISLPFSLPLYGDQISLLPILMGVSMFLQQKMMGTQTSGQQKYMSYFMTIFFLLIFNQFPSGLNLYYTLFNVLTILQQKYLVTPAKPATEPVSAKRKR